MPPGIGDEEPPLSGIGEQAGGVAHSRRTGLRLARGAHSRNGSSLERPRALGRLDQRSDRGVEIVHRLDPGGLRDHSSLRVQEKEGRPRPHTESPPESELGVVDDGVNQTESFDRRPHRLGAPLALELGAVRADQNQLQGSSLAESSQARHHPPAGEGTRRPEVEEDHLAAQSFEIERRFRVDPLHPGRKERGGGIRGLG